MPKDSVVSNRIEISSFQDPNMLIDPRHNGGDIITSTYGDICSYTKYAAGNASKLKESSAFI